MKKIVSIITILVIIFGIFLFTNNVYAEAKAIDEQTESKLIEIKESATNSIEDYKAKYGSDVYGVVAYILNIVRIYSIPFCFLGIAIAAINRYMLGVRKLDTQEKGMALMVTFITLLII